MGNQEALIYCVMISDEREEETMFFLSGPLNSCYLQEWLENLKKQSACEQIIIRNIMYLK